MARVDYTADNLAVLGQGSIVTSPDEQTVAIKITDTAWGVSEYPLPVHDHYMFQFSLDWSNVRTILKKEGQ